MIGDYIDWRSKHNIYVNASACAPRCRLSPENAQAIGVQNARSANSALPTPGCGCSPRRPSSRDGLGCPSSLTLKSKSHGNEIKVNFPHPPPLCSRSSARPSAHPPFRLPTRSFARPLACPPDVRPSAHPPVHPLFSALPFCFDLLDLEMAWAMLWCFG